MTESQQTILPVLLKGVITLQGQFVLGSNYTFLVNVTHAGREFRAVYKPQRGEQPLWDFPEASLAGREVAAYRISQALGWSLVPPTVLRDGPFGPGSLQQYIEYNPNQHYFNFKPADKALLRPVALFDLLVNNADRKGSHIFFQKHTRHLYAIDHGLCFHADDKLRTVLWDFAGEAFPEKLIEKLRVTFHDSRGVSSCLSADLQPFLRPEEIDALNVRAEVLLADPVFPFEPQDRRAYPYPPL